MNKRKTRAFLAVISCAILSAITSLMFYSPAGLAQAIPEAATSAGGVSAGWGLLAAAIATGLSSIGAAIAVARVGSAAVGVLAEKPEMFGRLLIMVGLAEGIAIYGLIVSILILDRLG